MAKKQTSDSRDRVVHWLGAGLSSAPGIRAVIKSGFQTIVWNRTLSKAYDAIAPVKDEPNVRASEFSLSNLKDELWPGDIVVSMLPATMHPEIARLCLAEKAHLVTTSYVSTEMRALDAEARAAKLSFINEAGLDPGLDHLMARELVNLFRESSHCTPDVKLSLKSLCGGFPETPGEFRYKFSWSPLGVLRALTNQARFIEAGQIKTADQPWKNLFSFSYRDVEYEAYPNRDSLPYLEEYGFDDQSQVSRFVRGTIRPKGWAKAWGQVFSIIENGKSSELEKLSDELWSRYQYIEKERDRVLLYVELEAYRGEDRIWSRALSIDQLGLGKESAMARAVSLPATFAVDYIFSGRAPFGVSGPPIDRIEGAQWLRRLKKYDIAILDETTEPYDSWGNVFPDA